ncbi:MAG: DsrE/DsrF/DrsH-like family protein [Spirochaetales bacterium]|nr:DsrE/DsrF/DrsH-like family protein [Spirochaetales bacterium]
MENKKKLSIICFSGDFDKAVAALTLATGAAAVNWEVNLFFTFWGFNIVKTKGGHSFIGRGFLAKVFNFLMGGRKSMPLSRLNFGGASPKLMTGMMKNQNIANLEELYQAAKDLGINLYACEMSMNIFGMTRDDLDPAVKEVIGVPTFLKYSEGGETLFI